MIFRVEAAAAAFLTVYIYIYIYIYIYCWPKPHDMRAHQKKAKKRESLLERLILCMTKNRPLSSNGRIWQQCIFAFVFLSPCNLTFWIKSTWTLILIKKNDSFQQNKVLNC